MSLKFIKPTTPGQRKRVLVDYSNLSKTKPPKNLVKGISRPAGRNNHGRLTVYTKGGGHKRKYRLIDFKRHTSQTAIVQSIEYDPFRTAFIALIKSEEGRLSYILAPEGLHVGDSVESGAGSSIALGSALPLGEIPIGTLIHNIELKPGKGAQLVRSAGSKATLIQKDGEFARVVLLSGEHRLIPLKCFATIGSLSNADHSNIRISKAGRSRWLGKRPSVRGVAMNPVDHPHGGGEGKTSGGRPSVSPWGKLTKGPRTRKIGKKNNLIVQTRREK